MLDAIILLSLVTVQRGLELLWGRSNEAALRRRGAVEVGAAHYPVIVCLHGAWLASLWIWGWDRAIAWIWVWLFLILQGLRLWVLSALGRRWTTRVLYVPGEVLVTRGPFRFLPHPNYAVVALEMPLLPLAFRLTSVAIVFGLANLAVLAWRIRTEERALAPLRV